jgi:hypothetical protein
MYHGQELGFAIRRSGLELKMKVIRVARTTAVSVPITTFSISQASCDPNVAVTQILQTEPATILGSSTATTGGSGG